MVDGAQAGASAGFTGNHRRRLVIMVKEPVAGRVKTRLGQDIGVSARPGSIATH